MVLPSMRLDGKVAIVTGAGSGIGKAIAVAAAEAGADCVPTELPGKVERLEPVCEAIRERGRRALGLPLHLPDLSSIDTMVTKAIEEMGIYPDFDKITDVDEIFKVTKNPPALFVEGILKSEGDYLNKEEIKKILQEK